MSDFKPVKTVIIGCGMIASKGYQPQLVGVERVPSLSAQN